MFFWGNCMVICSSQNGSVEFSTDLGMAMVITTQTWFLKWGNRESRTRGGLPLPHWEKMFASVLATHLASYKTADTGHF